MIRELKFRAWKNNKMIYGVEPLHHRSEPTCIGYVEPSFPIIEPAGEKRYMILIKVDAVMQSTGHNDANGVEIYEGDMVNTENNVVEMSALYGATINGDRPLAVFGSHLIVVGNKFEGLHAQPMEASGDKT